MCPRFKRTHTCVRDLNSPIPCWCWGFFGIFFTRDLCTMVQNSRESGCKYWAIGLLLCSFAHIFHSFFCSALLVLLTCSTAHIHLLALALHCAYLFAHLLARCLSKARGKINDLIFHYKAVLNHSAPQLTLTFLFGTSNICVFLSATRSWLLLGMSGEKCMKKVR